MSGYEDQDSRQQSYTNLSTSTNDEKTDREKVKQKLASEKRKAALHCGPELFSYSIHVASLAFTVVVLQLSFRGVYWADEDGWSNNGWSLGLSQSVMAGVLQFVAKVHEIFNLASLSTIVIDIIRRRLLMSLGMPFGFLIGAYQFGSASSLVSGSFWGPFTDSIRYRKMAALGLGFLLGLGSIYANAIGPASAVLIVPTLSWWPAYDLTVLMSGDGKLYTKYLDTSEWMSAYCLSDNETLSDGCPGLGAKDLRNADHYTQQGDSANQTFTQRYGTARRNLYASPPIEARSGGSIVRISSTLHSVVLEAIGLGGRFASTFANADFWKYSIYEAGRPQLESISTSNVMSPVVQVDCKATNISDIRSNGDRLFFPTSLLSTSDSLDQLPKVPRQFWWHWENLDPNSTDNVEFQWIGRDHFQFPRQESNGSIGSLAAIRYDAKTEQFSEEGFDVMFVACIFDARWATTDIKYDPINSDLVTSNISDMSLFAETTFNEELRASYGVGDLIQIQSKWADLLNPPILIHPYEVEWLSTPVSESAIVGQWVPAIVSYLNKFTQNSGTASSVDSFSVGTAPDAIASLIAHFLSLTMADGLSRVATKEETIHGTVWDPDEASYTIFGLDGSGITGASDGIEADVTEAVFKVKRYGWGYGTETKTAKFAVSILLIHSVIAVAYMLFTVTHWFLYTVISRSWKNMDSLFALAMVSSKPPSLKGVSAGIGTWDTWKLDVAIRENQETHESIELVFGGRDGEPVGREDGKVQWRKKYD